VCPLVRVVRISGLPASALTVYWFHYTHCKIGLKCVQYISIYLILSSQRDFFPYLLKFLDRLHLLIVFM
jgi:hypothetical protein